MDRLLTEVLGKRKRRDSSGKKGKKKGKSNAPPPPQRITNEQEMNQQKREALHILRKSRTSKLKNTKKQLNQVDIDLDQASPSSSTHQELLTKKEYLNNQLELLRDLDVNDILEAKIKNIKDESKETEEPEEMAKLQERIASVPNLHPILTRIAELQLSYERSMEKKRKKKMKQVEQNPSPNASESDQSQEDQSDDEPASIPRFLRPMAGSEGESSIENAEEDDSFNSAEDLGVTEGFTIQVPSFGESNSLSESDSDAAIDIREHYSDDELDDPEYDEQKDSSADGEDDDVYSSSDEDEDAVVQAELARLAQMDGVDEDAAEESSSDGPLDLNDSPSVDVDDFESSVDGTSEIEMNLSPIRKRAKKNSLSTPHTKTTPKTKPKPSKPGKSNAVTSTENIFIGSLNGGANPLLSTGKDTPKNKKKKNRPGQNARRAEREKALRIQNREARRERGDYREREHHDHRDRDHRGRGRDRNQYDSPRRNSRRETHERPPRSNDRRAHGGHTPAPPPEQKPEDLASLHPSWAARKKETNIADFKGKKMTFDSDSE